MCTFTFQQGDLLVGEYGSGGIHLSFFCTGENQTHNPGIASTIIYQLNHMGPHRTTYTQIGVVRTIVITRLWEI
jgi:hypothetical protein